MHLGRRRTSENFCLWILQKGYDTIKSKSILNCKHQRKDPKLPSERCNALPIHQGFQQEKLEAARTTSHNSISLTRAGETQRCRSRPKQAHLFQNKRPERHPAWNHFRLPRNEKESETRAERNFWTQCIFTKSWNFRTGRLHRGSVVWLSSVEVRL